MKKIILNNGSEALVDDDFYAYLNQWNWTISSHGYAYKVQRYGPRKENKQKQIYMHRLIMNPFFINDIEVDHINGDTLDNQKSNLRIVTRSQNRMNQHKVKVNGSSKYKGVCWKKAEQKWIAKIKVNGQNIHLGYYRTEKDAARAYDEAAIKHFGEYARPNLREAVK